MTQEHHPELKAVEPSDAALELLARRTARQSLAAFIQYCWWGATPFIEGLHTHVICSRIDKAVQDYLDGHSTYLIIMVPFRHGKSDISSRALPPYFLGRCASAQPDVICTGYGAEMVQGFSRQAKSIIRSEAYRALFPGVRLSSSITTDAKWRIEIQNHHGKWRLSSGETTVTGLDGALTGSGYSLGVVDDYCKNRKEAESTTYQNRVWESFTNDFLTRRAPVSVTIVTATPWHVDDLIGRTLRAQDEIPDFPKFELLRFPARGGAKIRKKAYDYEYLFPERFDESWYRGHYASLGSYASAGLLDCDPVVMSGNLFNIGSFKYVRPDEVPSMRFVRFWDLASTEKEVAKDDPDYTAGAKVGMDRGPNGEPRLWVADLKAGQWMAPERNEVIRQVAMTDGPGVRVLVEAVGGYKDAVAIVKKLLRGHRYVRGVSVSKDKVVRAEPLMPVIEAGNFHVVLGDWNDLLIKQFREFPHGNHDDVVDSVSGAYDELASMMGLRTLNLTRSMLGV